MARMLMGGLLLSGCPDIGKLAVGEDGKPNPKAPPQILNDYGNRLDDAGKHREAIEFYEAALKGYGADETKDRSTAHYNLGLAYRGMGENESAVEHYARAIEIDPTSVNPYINIGPALEDLGRANDAIEYYRAGVELHPDELHLIENLASAYIKQERHDDALPIVKRAYAKRREALVGGDEHTRWMMRWRNYLDEHDR